VSAEKLPWQCSGCGTLDAATEQCENTAVYLAKSHHGPIVLWALGPSLGV